MYSLPNSYDEAAAILDKDSPGWFERIDQSKLDMEVWHTCILGQVYGDYCKGLQILFNSKSSPYYANRASRLEWIKQIDKRLNRKMSQPSTLPYKRKAERLNKQADIHAERAENLLKKAKAEIALSASLRKAAKLAYKG